MARVIGVRFRDNGKIYYFASEQFEVEFLTFTQKRARKNTRQSSQRARLLSGSTASRPSSSQHFQTTSLFLKKISNR